MKNKIVTIFGASGFLGRYIVKRLADQGAVIRACCRNVDEAKHLKTLGGVGQVTPMSIDIQHQKLVESVCRDADYVINCVGLINVRNAKNFDLIHHLAPKKLAEICWTLGVEKLVHVSALGVNHKPHSIYGKTKLLGEQALLKEFSTATIIRPSLIFGPEDQFLNRFAAMMQISPIMPLIGGGKNRVQPVYVNDVAMAIVKVLQDDQTKGKIYELGGPKVYTFKELMMYLLSEIRRDKWVISVPNWFMRFEAFFLQWLPGIPLTPDQVRMLKDDSIVDEKSLKISDLGIESTPLELIAPIYLSRYRSTKRTIPFQK